MATIEKKPIHIKVDIEVKEEAEKLFDDLGMNLTTAITLFLKQSIRDRQLPFTPSLESRESVAARHDVENNQLEEFASVDDWWASVNED